MTKIFVDNKYCKIVDETDLEFLKRLDFYLSFMYLGAEFTPAFKSGRWNGRENLLSKKLEFLSGLLERVKDFFILNNKQFNIVDLRKPFLPGKEIDLSEKLNELGIIPYDYQLAAVEEALKYDRSILRHATGSGKSLTAALITAKLGLSTTIWVIGIDLLYQFHELFSKLFDQKIGMVGNGICDVQQINIASVWTAGKALGLKNNEILADDEFGSEKYEPTDREKILKLVKETKIHIYDECHVSSAKTIRTIYKNSNPERLVGLSGTPYREDGSDLLIEGIFSRQIHEVKASDLIRRGILAKPYIKFLYVKSHSHYTDQYTKVYADSIVNNLHRNNLIVTEAKKLADKNYQTLVLFKQIKHGKILKELFDKRDIEVEFLTGKDNNEKRERAKNNLLSRKSNICLASQIYDLGISIETLSALILAGAGRSSIRALQRIGRVIRGGKIKGKPVAAVIDLYDDVKYMKKQALVRKNVYETEEEFVISMPKEFKNK